MINLSAKLNKKVLTAKVETVPTRNGFGEALVELGEKNKNVVVLSADLTESTRAEDFSKKFPERFFTVGVAEQNLITMASGLGVTGKIPFACSYAVFSPGRNWEQIRTTIAYNNSNVKIAGHHAGLVTGADGATHQSIEDIATMRVIPNMRVFVPCDAIEAKKMTIASAKIYGPIYLRFSRNKTPIITTEETPFNPDKAEIFYNSFLKKIHKGKKGSVLIVACGHMVYDALIAAAELEKSGILSIVLNMHTIKPLDEKTLIECAKKCDAVITAEDHNVIGGLGSAVAEALAKKLPKKMEFVGIKDTFGESGETDELKEKYGINKEAIIRAAEKLTKETNKKSAE